MAGENEEPFCLEAHSVHSGSISFGRFETEPLSWESRSTFLHNRYLEEVKRYSKPGSVNQRKAYFEVYFRRKALLQMPFSQDQNWMESQASEKETVDHVKYMGKPELARNSHPSPNCHGENEAMGHRKDDQVEAYQSQVERITPLIEDRLEVDVEQKCFNEAEAVRPPENTKQSAKSHMDGKLVNPISRKYEKAKSEIKTFNAEMQTSVTLSQIQRETSSSSQSSNPAAKISSRLEKGKSLSSNTKKQSVQKIPTVKYSLPKTSKSKDCENRKEKQRQQHVSANVKQTRKLKTLNLGKDECRTDQSANRSKPTINSSEKTVKPSALTINIKINGREAKIKDEGTETGTKEMQKGPNHKIALVPPLHHKSVPQGSVGKKSSKLKEEGDVSLGRGSKIEMECVCMFV